jgi:hypothetical protein
MTLFCFLLAFNFQPLENRFFIFDIKVIIITIQGQKKIEKNPKTRIHEDDEHMIIITFLICYQEIKLQFLSFVLYEGFLFNLIISWNLVLATFKQGVPNKSNWFVLHVFSRIEKLDCKVFTIHKLWRKLHCKTFPIHKQWRTKISLWRTHDSQTMNFFYTTKCSQLTNNKEKKLHCKMLTVHK